MNFVYNMPNATKCICKRYAGTLVMYNFAIAPTPIEFSDCVELTVTTNTNRFVCAMPGITSTKHRIRFADCPSNRQFLDALKTGSCFFCSYNTTYVVYTSSRYKFFVNVFCIAYTLLLCTLSQRTVENIGQVLSTFKPSA